MVFGGECHSHMIYRVPYHRLAKIFVTYPLYHNTHHTQNRADKIDSVCFG